MAFYENVFITRQDASAAQVDSLRQTFTDLLQEKGGKVTKHEYWGLRTLAYRMEKNRKGHYVLMNIDAPADAIQELERRMRFSEDVVRYLTVKVEQLDTAPSAIMQSMQKDRKDALEAATDEKPTKPRAKKQDDDKETGDA